MQEEEKQRPHGGAGTLLVCPYLVHSGDDGAADLFKF